MPGHLFEQPEDPTAYSLRFGTVDNQADATSEANLRQIDRIVLHPDRADVAMVHFADPVPEGTWIPDLATEAPAHLDPIIRYGWGEHGRLLRRMPTQIVDPVATENAVHLRAESPLFAVRFPEDIQPMVIDAITVLGDSGGGIFLSFPGEKKVLAGVNWGETYYRPVNESGKLTDEVFEAPYAQPVRQHRKWIEQTINGEDSSNSAPAPAPAPEPDPDDEELRRRRLQEIEGSGLPMTPPPPTEVCDPGDKECTLSDPVWKPAALQGPGIAQGTVPARCAGPGRDGCSFDGTTYGVGSTGRLRLGGAGTTGTREVMVWCKATTVLNTVDPPQQVLMVSFTNLDRRKVPIGQGWWYVPPSRLLTSAGVPLDTAPFATC